MKKGRRKQINKYEYEASDIQGRISRISSQARRRAKALERALRMFLRNALVWKYRSSAIFIFYYSFIHSRKQKRKTRKERKKEQLSSECSGQREIVNTEVSTFSVLLSLKNYVVITTNTTTTTTIDRKN